MKNLKFLYTVLFCTVLSLCFAACSNDDEGSIGSSLIGSWEDMQYDGHVLHFNKDKTGYNERTSVSTTTPIIFDNFTSWECTDTQLFITWEGNKTNGSYHVPGTFMYYYILSDNLLTIYHDDGELWSTFKKK